MPKIGFYIDRVMRVAPAAILLAGLPLAAQSSAPLSCAVLSVPTQVRAEGLTELIGDIVLSCTGGAPTPVGRTIPQGNIAVYLNTNVTSRIFSNGGSEALLLIDEPLPPSTTSPPPNPQTACASITGCLVPGNGGAGEVFNGSDAAHPNVFQGVVSGNSVTFQGVPIEAPAGGGTRTYRITNVRANASAVPSSTGISTNIMASVSASGSTALPLSNPVRIVGAVQSGLSFAAGAVTTSQCAQLSDATQSAALVYSEGFPSAFRPRTSANPDPNGGQRTPGVDYYSESGLVVPELSNAGLADFGTRFKAVFRNIPAGVTAVWVATSNVGATTNMAQMTLSESGPFYPVASTNTIQGIPTVQLPVANGTATAVWEVTAASPLVQETFFFPVFFDSSTGLDPNAPTATVNGSFAPTASAFPSGDGGQAQPASFPIPRFIDTSTATTIILVLPCQTLLLFPMVTNQGGFDTGLAISNTSSDPIGTAAQAGTCTLNAYGANAPAPLVTPSIAAGSSYTMLASTVFPNFNGYIFALCNFQYAHGFAFISDIGARNLAMGYLALVVGQGLPRTGAPSGESAVN